MADKISQDRKKDGAINTDNIDLGSIDDLNLDFPMDGGGVDIGGGRKPGNPKKEFAVEFMKGVGGGVKTATKSELRKVLPNTSVLIDDVGSAIDDFKSLKDDLSRQLAPMTASIEGATRKLLPRVEKYLPKKLYSKVTQKLDERAAARAGSSYSPASKEQQERDTIASELGAIFGATAESNLSQLRDNKKEIMLDRALGSTRHKQSVTALTRIYDATRSTELFHRTQHMAYMKKSLELKYKHIFIAKDTFNLMARSMASFESYFKAITQNTALPDMAKTAARDYIKKSRSDLYGTMMADATSNIHRKIIDNIKAKAKELVENFGDISSNISMGADMADMALGNKDPIPGLLGKGLGWWKSSPILKRFIGKYAPYTGTIDNAVKSWKSNAATRVADLKQRMGNSDNPILQTIADFLPNAFGAPAAGSNDLLKNPTDPAQFDIMTRQSITEIIPGYLGKIWSEIRKVRLGDDAKDMTYNVFSRKFTTEDEIKGDIREQLVGDEKARRNVLNRTIADLQIGMTQNRPDLDAEIAFDDIKEDVNKFFINMTQNGQYLNIREIRKFLAETGSDEFKPDEYSPSYYMRITTRGFKNSSISGVRKVMMAIMDSMYDKDGNLDKGQKAKIDAAVNEYARLDQYKAELPRMRETLGLGHLMASNISGHEEKQIRDIIASGGRIKESDTKEQMKQQLEDAQKRLRAAGGYFTSIAGSNDINHNVIADERADINYDQAGGEYENWSRRYGFKEAVKNNAAILKLLAAGDKVGAAKFISMVYGVKGVGKKLKAYLSGDFERQIDPKAFDAEIDKTIQEWKDKYGESLGKILHMPNWQDLNEEDLTDEKLNERYEQIFYRTGKDKHEKQKTPEELEKERRAESSKRAKENLKSAYDKAKGDSTGIVGVIKGVGGAALSAVTGTYTEAKNIYSDNPEAPKSSSTESTNDQIKEDLSDEDKSSLFGKLKTRFTESTGYLGKLSRRFGRQADKGGYGKALTDLLSHITKDANKQRKKLTKELKKTGLYKSAQKKVKSAKKSLSKRWKKERKRLEKTPGGTKLLGAIDTVGDLCDRVSKMTEDEYNELKEKGYIDHPGKFFSDLHGKVDKEIEEFTKDMPSFEDTDAMEAWIKSKYENLKSRAGDKIDDLKEKLDEKTKDNVLRQAGEFAIASGKKHLKETDIAKTIEAEGGLKNAIDNRTKGIQGRASGILGKIKKFFTEDPNAPQSEDGTTLSVNMGDGQVDESVEKSSSTRVLKDIYAHLVKMAKVATEERGVIANAIAHIDGSVGHHATVMGYPWYRKPFAIPRGIFKAATWTLGKAAKIYGSVYSGALKGIGLAAGGIGHAVGGLYNLAATTVGGAFKMASSVGKWAVSKKQFVDVYRKSDHKLLVSARMIKDGEVFNEKGELLKGSRDIIGPCYDKDHNILITEEDIKGGLEMDDGSPLSHIGGGLLTLGKAYFGMYGAAFKVAGSLLGGAGKLLLGSRSEKFVDVYRKDEIDKGPLITRRQQVKKMVAFANKEFIERSSDIHMPVYDITIDPPSEVIRQEDIDHGLVDINNKPLGSGGDHKGLLMHGFAGLKSLGKLAGTAVFGKEGSGGLLGMYAKMYGGLFGLGGKALGGVGKMIGRALGLDVGGLGKPDKVTKTAIIKSHMILKEIRDYLIDGKKKKPGDNDGDGDIDGSYADQMEKKGPSGPTEKVDLAKEHKDINWLAEAKKKEEQEKKEDEGGAQGIIGTLTGLLDKLPFGLGDKVKGFLKVGGKWLIHNAGHLLSIAGPALACIGVAAAAGMIGNFIGNKFSDWLDERDKKNEEEENKKQEQVLKDIHKKGAENLADAKKKKGSLKVNSFKLIDRIEKSKSILDKLKWINVLDGNVNTLPEHQLKIDEMKKKFGPSTTKMYQLVQEGHKFSFGGTGDSVTDDSKLLAAAYEEEKNSKSSSASATTAPVEQIKKDLAKQEAKPEEKSVTPAPAAKAPQQNASVAKTAGGTKPKKTKYTLNGTSFDKSPDEFLSEFCGQLKSLDDYKKLCEKHNVKFNGNWSNFAFVCQHEAREYLKKNGNYSSTSISRFAKVVGMKAASYRKKLEASSSTDASKTTEAISSDLSKPSTPSSATTAPVANASVAKASNPASKTSSVKEVKTWLANSSMTGTLEDYVKSAQQYGADGDSDAFESLIDGLDFESWYENASPTDRETFRDQIQTAYDKKDAIGRKVVVGAKIADEAKPQLVKAPTPNAAVAQASQAPAPSAPSAPAAKATPIESDRQKLKDAENIKGALNVSTSTTKTPTRTRRVRRYSGRMVAGQFLGELLTEKQYKFIKATKDSIMGAQFRNDATIMEMYAKAEQGQFRPLTEAEQAQEEKEKQKKAAAEARRRKHEEDMKDPKKKAAYEARMKKYGLDVDVDDNFARGGFATEPTFDVDGKGNSILYGEAGTEGIMPVRSKPGNLTDRVGQKLGMLLNGQDIGPSGDGYLKGSAHAGTRDAEPMENLLARELAKSAKRKFADGGFVDNVKGRATEAGKELLNAALAPIAATAFGAIIASFIPIIVVMFGPALVTFSSLICTAMMVKYFDDGEYGKMAMALLAGGIAPALIIAFFALLGIGGAALGGIFAAIGPVASAMAILRGINKALLPKNCQEAVDNAIGFIGTAWGSATKLAMGIAGTPIVSAATFGKAAITGDFDYHDYRGRGFKTDENGNYIKDADGNLIRDDSKAEPIIDSILNAPHRAIDDAAGLVGVGIHKTVKGVGSLFGFGGDQTDALTKKEESEAEIRKHVIESESSQPKQFASGGFVNRPSGSGYSQPGGLGQGGVNPVDINKMVQQMQTMNDTNVRMFKMFSSILTKNGIKVEGLDLLTQVCAQPQQVPVPQVVQVPVPSSGPSGLDLRKVQA